MPYLGSQDLLTEFQLKCVGLINAEWALTEAVMSIAIWDYLKLDRKNGLSVTADLGSLAKIQMLGSLAKLRFEGDSTARQTIAGIVGTLKTCNSERNTVAHNLWLPGVVADSIQATKATTRDAKLSEKALAKTDGDLMDIFQRISVARADLEDFQKDHGLTPPSRPIS